jgi:hypothetical protein
MRLGLLLFGVSLEINKHWQYGTLYSLDYNNSYDNYQKYIFEYFTKKGYDIDVYISTNKFINDKDVNELTEKYKPVKCSFIEDREDIVLSRNKKLESVIDLCINEGNEYDLILITRFDLLFQKDFANSNIDFDKINIVSVLEKSNLICDNFYLFPYKYLIPFKKIIKKCSNINHRNIKKDLEKIDSINYILNENCDINELSFYKIIKTSYI